jgi:hypothetical protein
MLHLQRASSIPTRGSSFTGEPFGILRPVSIGLSAVYKVTPTLYGSQPVTHSPEERMLEAPAGKTMVKIVEIAEEDDDCCEIDLAEFAKKVTLKAAGDDVVVVAAQGPVGSSDSLFLSWFLCRFHACLAGQFAFVFVCLLTQ